MKSWLKALLISAVILAGCIFYLPTLAKQGINSLLPWAMEQAGLTEANGNISHLSWRKLHIDSIQFFSPAQNSLIKLDDLQVTFSPWQIISGQLKDIIVENIHIEMLASNGAESTSKKAEPQHLTHSNNTPPSEEGTPLELPSLEYLFSQLPLNSVAIKQFKFIHPLATIDTQILLNQQQLSIKNKLQTKSLNKYLNHQITVNKQGEIESLIFIEQSPVPIFNLHANWKASADTLSKTKLSLQQSADIQSWLTLIEQKNQTSKLNAKVAIQAWNLELDLPRVIDNQYQLLSQLSASGLMQIKINDFNVFDIVKNENIIEQAELAINLQTNIDSQRDEQWEVRVDTLDLSGEINSLAPIDLKLKQFLKEAIIVTCSIKSLSNHCQWKGAIAQELTGDKLAHNTVLSISGQLDDQATDNNNNNKNETSNTREFISQLTLNFDTRQENPLWPKAHNKSQGDIIVQGQHKNSNWHWQMSMPHGFDNQSQYLEILFADKPDAQLSEIRWQLLPDWFIEGINGELTQAKEFSIVLDQLNWKNTNESLQLDSAIFSCNLDWLKLQYSKQLTSQQALSQLPLACHWQVSNHASRWNQWPVPALKLTGEVNLTSLDVKQAILNARINLSGLKDSLDLTLLAQHNFTGLQQGSAQLYLKNLKLDWQKMGLLEMADLTQAQLLDGSISAQGWIQWQQYQQDIFDDTSIAWRWQPDLMLRIDDMFGVYQASTTWEDVDVQLALRRPFYTDFRIDSQVSALGINPGINIANVLARSTATIQSDFSQALIVIEEVHTDVLGGRINVPLIRFDTSQEVNAFGIEVEGLQVEQLAALEAGAGIDATGQLDGVLPIILLPEGPQVPAGSLYARSPGGIVQYRGATADSLKKSDPSVGLAMQVLDDFRYDKLQTNVTYQPNGELKLGLQFQGHNPTFFDGQATHFNLNLDYNLLDLLESLRISNDIVQKLENKYQ